MGSEIQQERRGDPRAKLRAAIVLPAGGPVTNGQAEIQKFFADVIGKGFHDHKVTVASAEVKGNVVVAFGRGLTTRVIKA